jgi:hypothetical protein
VGVGLQPIATIATHFKKLSKKKTLRKFSVLGGIGGKPACPPAQGELRPMQDQPAKEPRTECRKL